MVYVSGTIEDGKIALKDDFSYTPNRIISMTNGYISDSLAMHGIIPLDEDLFTDIISNDISNYSIVHQNIKETKIYDEEYIKRKINKEYNLYTRRSHNRISFRVEKVSRGYIYNARNIVMDLEFFISYMNDISFNFKKLKSKKHD